MLTLYQVRKPSIEQAEREFERFQLLAQDIRDDLAILLERMEDCWAEIQGGRAAPAYPQLQLLWDVGTDQLQFVFASYGVWRKTERAIRYYRQSMAALQGTQPLNAQQVLAVRGAVTLLKAAIADLEARGKLPAFVRPENV
jgi:hypothetical protein